jgi:hypothetical protein
MKLKQAGAVLDHERAPSPAATPVVDILEALKKSIQDDSETCCVAAGPKARKGHGDQEQAAVSRPDSLLVLSAYSPFLRSFSHPGDGMRWCTGAALQRWSWKSGVPGTDPRGSCFASGRGRSKTSRRSSVTPRAARLADTGGSLHLRGCT